MASWRDVAAQVMADDQARETVSSHVPADPQGPDRYGLDADLYRDLARLRHLPPPHKIAKRERWAVVVEDALRLAREGWAANALALGWSRTDLFGVGTVDDREFSGLAVWINGRSVAMLDAHVAIVTVRGDADTFVRGGMGHGTHPTIAPVLLWDWGRS